MIWWPLRRIGQSVVLVLAMTVIVFLAVNVIGNPAAILIAPDADQAEQARVVAQYGFDRPLWEQYWRFLSELAQGQFVRSFVYGESALAVTLQRFPATLELAVCALLIATVLGLPIGLHAGLRPHSWLSRTTMAGSIVGFSLPNFWLGLLLIMVFAVELGWLPSGGRGKTAEFLGVQWAFLTADGLRHLLLPAVTLATAKAALVARLVRAGVREVLPRDHIRFARAKGVPEHRIVGVHVLRNIMIPVVTVIGIEFGSLIAFSVVTENVFAWPGMGKLIVDSISVLDRPVMLAYLMVTIVVFVAINLAVDLAYTLLDPRVRVALRGAR